jgi:hypothetical protein
LALSLTAYLHLCPPPSLVLRFAELTRISTTSQMNFYSEIEHLKKPEKKQNNIPELFFRVE